MGKHNVKNKAAVRIYCTCGWSYGPDKVNHIDQAEMDDDLYDAHAKHAAAMYGKEMDDG